MSEGKPARHEGPLLVYGPRSPTYDFGPHHPLTPRRFGPGIDLLRGVGAEPGLAPEPASDDELMTVHTHAYVETVRRFSEDPRGWPDRGIGPGDTPAFLDMHEAGGAVAGGSLQAVEAILRGDVEHAHHPGGGLHHAMPDRASGFCIYDDPALAIARARAAGLRVLYVDLDVHHGDGVQVIHQADPSVLTVSFHESGETLFPGTGFVDELGSGTAAGTSVNVPFEAFSGDDAWWPAVNMIVPELAAAFGPDLVVSQHGADAHAWDPLAHLHVTTLAMSAAARLIDEIAHRWAGGRWLATGGGGYDAYRVVPRVWALTWLAGAHREPPAATPAAWRDRWAAEAEEYGQSPLPERFLDEPNAGLPVTERQLVAEAASKQTAGLVRAVTVPRLIRESVDRGWWTPASGPIPTSSARDGWASVRPLHHRPAILPLVEPAVLDRLSIAPRVIAPLDPAAAHELLRAAVRTPGVAISAALDDTTIVGLVVSASSTREPGVREVLGVGVAPAARGAGLAGRLLASHVESLRPGDEALVAVTTVAERDPVDPLPVGTRTAIAGRLATGVGMVPLPVDRPIQDADATAFAFRLDRLGS